MKTILTEYLFLQIGAKMNRYEILKTILHKQNCFKTICGAGNEDKAHVKKLAFIYTLAGTTILDVSANVDKVC